MSGARQPNIRINAVKKAGGRIGLFVRLEARMMGARLVFIFSLEAVAGRIEVTFAFAGTILLEHFA